MISSGPCQKPCMWKPRDLGEGISRALSLGISPLEQTKKDRRSTDPRSHPLEETVVVPGLLGGTQTLQVSALAGAKLPMNFWCSTTLSQTVPSIGKLVSNLLPAVQLPGASARRTTALEMFRATHIQPSHRRMPHVLWTDSMTLIWNLLKGRYLVLNQRVELRRFSAGSFDGLSTLQ